MIFKILYHLKIHSLFRVLKRKDITILCLHRISNEKDFFFNPISIDQFKLLVKYVSNYYEIIHFNDIDLIKTKKKKLILSFDDGYYDFYENALPILFENKIKANHNIVNISANDNEVIWTQKLNSIFNFYKNIRSIEEVEMALNSIEIPILNTYSWQVKYMQTFNLLMNENKINRNEKINYALNKKSISLENIKMMNWSQIKECSINNIEIGSHSYTHDNFSLIDNNEKLFSEIDLSIQEINDKLNISCSIFSLPNGKINNFTREYLQKSDIKHILVVNDSTKHNPPFFDRIYLINEKSENMICRSELIHQKIKQTFKK
jgi:peptidoglycan/xylan/chitin deacetylase (PgdA/CDA1 family)